VAGWTEKRWTDLLVLRRHTGIGFHSGLDFVNQVQCKNNFKPIAQKQIWSRSYDRRIPIYLYVQ
jgi:hypothetical protein